MTYTIMVESVMWVSPLVPSPIDDSTERQDVMEQVYTPPEEQERNQAVRGDSQLEEQLRHTQDRLRLKEEEVKRGGRGDIGLLTLP